MRFCLGQRLHTTCIYEHYEVVGAVVELVAGTLLFYGRNGAVALWAVYCRPAHSPSAFCILYLNVLPMHSTLCSACAEVGMCGTAGASAAATAAAAGVYVAGCNANPLWHSRDETAGLHFFGAGMWGNGDHGSLLPLRAWENP